MNRVKRVDDRVAIRNVLISVSDKSELDVLAPVLAELQGVTIYSTGGTFRRLSEILAGSAAALRQVSDYTGQPEMQGGLVKTLDFKIYLGLLSEPYNEDHDKDRQRVAAQLIDMVVCNLYPFRSVSSRRDSDSEDARSNIDIGGPCMLRAAAKCYLRVAALCDPSDYRPVTEELRQHSGTLGIDTRFRLAQKAFGHTAQYDRAIADYLSERSLAEAVTPYAVSGKE
jgi:phosphoribosylaminoimidazolecarboxamide formyltransferase / IMP cyclohydrolase